MNKQIKWGAIILIVVLIVGMIFYPNLKKKAPGKETTAGAPSPGKGPKDKILNINAIVLKYQTLSDKIVSTGNIIPDEEVDLSFESSGKVTNIYFKEGTHVKKGDLLAKINDKPLQAQLKKLEAEIPLAEDRLFRQKTLLAKDAVSQEAFEQVSTENEKLKADIELVKANISQTELRAPFDGIIGLRNVSEGAFASPATIITKLTRIAPLKIDFSIPESYSSDVKSGTKILFRLQDEDGTVREYNASVYAVESKVDMNTRTLKVRASYPNVGEKIVPGRYTSVEITKREIEDALAVPSEAVIPEMGKNMIYLYKNGVAQPVEITTGIRTASHLQALSGVQEGDTVIVSGVMQLRTGTKVTIDHLNKGE